MIRESFIPYGNPPPEPTFDELDAMGPYPEEPLLSMEEIDNVRDLRYLLPEATQAQLAPDEIVVRVKDINLPEHTVPPSTFKTFMKLARVATLAQMGDNGPAIAALGGEDESDAAQNRFVAPHIRDAILTAKLRVRCRNTEGGIESRLRFPKLMRATLMHTAEEGGIIDEQFDPHRPFRQEKPGKAMLVNFGIRTPGGRKFSRYAGWGFPVFVSVDAAPLFISETADYVTEEEPGFLSEPYTARDGLEHPMGQFLDLAVERLLADLDGSKDGFLEFKNLDPRDDKGMLNQAWADSAGAYVHKDGEWANHKDGIAAVEVQGYAYDALIKAAGLYREKFQEPDKAAILEQRAAKLKRDFLDKFFITDERGTYARLVQLLRTEFEPRVVAHGGTVVKRAGDGSLVVFNEVRSAIACALEVQHSITVAEGSERPDRRISLRIGVNVGEVIVDGGDIYGDAVNIAARLQTYAEPGGIAVTGEVASHISSDPLIRAGCTGSTGSTRSPTVCPAPTAMRCASPTLAVPG